MINHREASVQAVPPSSTSITRKPTSKLIRWRLLTYQVNNILVGTVHSQCHDHYFHHYYHFYDYRHRPLVETATVDGAGGMEPTLAAQMEPQGLSSFLNEA